MRYFEYWKHNRYVFVAQKWIGYNNYVSCATYWYVNIKWATYLWYELPMYIWKQLTGSFPPNTIVRHKGYSIISWYIHNPWYHLVSSNWFSTFTPAFSITVVCLFKCSKTRRSENDNTPQPLDQWTNSPFIGQQVGNCKSFTLTHYLADLFAMHRGPRSISLCIQHHIQLTSLSFQVSRPSHS